MGWHQISSTWDELAKKRRACHPAGRSMRSGPIVSALATSEDAKSTPDFSDCSYSREQMRAGSGGGRSAERSGSRNAGCKLVNSVIYTDSPMSTLLTHDTEAYLCFLCSKLSSVPTKRLLSCSKISRSIQRNQKRIFICIYYKCTRGETCIYIIIRRIATAKDQYDSFCFLFYFGNSQLIMMLSSGRSRILS